MGADGTQPCGSIARWLPQPQPCRSPACATSRHARMHVQWSDHVTMCKERRVGATNELRFGNAHRRVQPRRRRSTLPPERQRCSQPLTAPTRTSGLTDVTPTRAPTIVPMTTRSSSGRSGPSRRSSASTPVEPAAPLRSVPSGPPPPAPKHLSKEAKDWWALVCADYELEAHELKLLQAAAEAWDRMRAAGRELEGHGLTYVDRHGQPRPRPEVGIERDARIAFARCLRELNLEAEAPADVRPPGLRGRYR